MKNIFLILFILIGIISLKSCLNDDSNYEYSDVMTPDSVFINFDGVTHKEKVLNFSVKYGQKVKLKPEVYYKGADDLEFIWHINGIPTYYTEEIELEIDFMGIHMDALEVKRANAGNSTFYTYNIISSVPCEKGFSVIAQQGGKNVMDFFEQGTVQEIIGEDEVTAVGFPIVENIYETKNGEELPAGDYIKMLKYTVSPYDPVYKYGTYLLLDKDINKSMNLGGLSFKKEVDLADEFIGSIPANTKLKDAIYLGYCSFLLTEAGKLYSRINYAKMPYTGQYFDMPVKYDNKELNVKRYAGNDAKTNKLAVVFDETTKQYFALCNGSTKPEDSGSVLPLLNNTSAYPDGFTPFDNMGKEVVKMLGYSYSTNRDLKVWTLLKDNASNYFVQKFYVEIDYKNRLKKLEPISEVPFIKGDIIKDNTKFYVCDNFKGKDMLIACDNKLYYYNMELNTEPKVLLEFSGKNITSMVASADVWDTSSEYYANTKGKFISLGFDNGDFVMYKFKSELDAETPIYEVKYEKHYDKIYSVDYFGSK